ncbi:MAG: methyltransferase domain-containing protein [Pseudomonadota bacterium]|nr:methyltransferase domain-containing protein [Pseudomonadota bacterium]
MSDNPSISGKIDQAGPLSAIDIVALAGGEAGWPEGYLAHGFGAETPALRQTVGRWGFKGLGRVADVGCGFGRWSPFLAEVNEEAVGFERNEKGVALGRQLADLFALNHLRFEKADITKLPVEDGAFDGVWCCNVLQFTDRGKVLRELNRILRIGGRLAILKYNGVGGVLETFYSGYARGGIDDHNARFALRCLRQGPLHDGRDNYGSVETAARMLETFGFSLVESPAATLRPGGVEETGTDLEALATRLETDAAFAEDFANRPAFADGFPVVLDLVAVKTADLDPLPPTRRDKIDAAGPLRALDLVKLAGGEEGWPAGYLAGGFGADAGSFRRIVERWGFAGLGRVAEIGCGYGRWSIFLAEFNDEAVGFEPKARGVELGRKLAAVFDLDNLRFETAELTALPVEPAALDGIWCWNVLQTLDRAAALAELNRVLRIGGRLGLFKYPGEASVLQAFVTGYVRGGLAHPHAKFALQRLKRGPLHDGPDNFGSMETAAAMLEPFGFTLEEAPSATFRSGEARRSGEDLATLAARLETDPPFAEAFVQRPELADGFPVLLDMVAIKTRELDARAS